MENMGSRVTNFFLALPDQICYDFEYGIFSDEDFAAYGKWRGPVADCVMSHE